MRALPDELEFAALVEPLLSGWRIQVAAVEYAPVGGGSYHWLVVDKAGERHFITVDDLDNKGWFGGTRAAALDGLAAAFDTAAALREHGLDFVVAPLRTSGGASLIRVSTRYTLSVLPFVDGEAGRFGEYTAPERAALGPMLAALHSTPVAARRLELALPLRGVLEQALAETDRRWESGPLAERARAVLTQYAGVAEELLARYDRLEATIASNNWVVTHGEPHAGNIIDSRFLVDWDTVALAPVERDLWMLNDDGSDSVAFFRLRWDLADLTAYTALLRSPHTENADTRRALEGVKVVLGRA